MHHGHSKGAEKEKILGVSVRLIVAEICACIMAALKARSRGKSKGCQYRIVL